MTQQTTKTATASKPTTAKAGQSPSAKAAETATAAPTAKTPAKADPKAKAEDKGAQNAPVAPKDAPKKATPQLPPPHASMTPLGIEPQKEAPAARSKAPKEDLVVFAIRLPKADRERLHEVAGKGKATGFVRDLVVAVANRDEAKALEVIRRSQQTKA